MRQPWESILVLLLTLLLTGGYLHPAQADDPTPDWMANLDCAEQKYRGLWICTGKGEYSNVHVIALKRDSPGLKVEYIIAEGVDGGSEVHECADVNRSTKTLGPGCDDPVDRNLYPAMSLLRAVELAKERLKNQPVALLINGDYGACALETAKCRKGIEYQEYREHGPEGLTIVHGNRLDGPKMGDTDNNAKNRPWLAISETAPLKALISQIDKKKQDNGNKPEDWMYTAVGGAPWLIKDGDIFEFEIVNCVHAPGSCYDNASQTAVGISKDDQWLFFVLAEKHKTLLDLAQFMKKKLDCQQAIKLDGGGSSKLWYDGAVIVPGDTRQLTNYLAIIAQPGTDPGSELPPAPDPEPIETPPPPETGVPWWTQIIRLWHGSEIYRTWVKINQQVQDIMQVVQAIQELLINIQNPAWWVSKANDALKPCGSLLLFPVTLLSVFWLTRRRSS